MASSVLCPGCGSAGSVDTLQALCGGASVWHVRRPDLLTATYPEPTPRPTTTMMAVAFGLFVVALPLIPFSLMLGSTAEAGSRIGGMVIVVALFGLAPALAAAVVVVRGRFNRRILRLRPQLWQVWNSAFYCQACAGCFLPGSSAAGLPAGQVMAPLRFRALLWNKVSPLHSLTWS